MLGICSNAPKLLPSLLASWRQARNSRCLQGLPPEFGPLSSRLEKMSEPGKPNPYDTRSAVGPQPHVSALTDTIRNEIRQAAQPLTPVA
ncbi:hypothetical protein HPB50_005348 [Hyalomma asiaticum]|uniref:Uncharacterized protein n=1 Tax=Hyalomma asiaticum TaxID=266040 RepID=A0ACB7SKW9_HYAAI|nr:hypothetical protein HPB50_005348 [Hyalomma asiaticum]